MRKASMRGEQGIAACGYVIGQLMQPYVALTLALLLGIMAAGCSQTMGSALPEEAVTPAVLSSDDQKKAIDDLVARRAKQEAEVQAATKTAR